MIVNDDFRNGIGKIIDANPQSLIVSDPPYNQRYHYSTFKDDLSSAEYSQLLSDAFSFHASVVIHYPEPTINLLAPAVGSPCLESVSWVYPSNTAKQSRLVTWWKCKPDWSKLGQPYKNPKDRRIAQRISEGKTARLYDWWEINQVKNVSKKDNSHPCPIPLELAERIITLTSDPGDLIIDPFAGSGTIGIAALRLNRRFIGFEIDTQYADEANARLKRLQNERDSY